MYENIIIVTTLITFDVSWVLWEISRRSILLFRVQPRRDQKVEQCFAFCHVCLRFRVKQISSRMMDDTNDDCDDLLLIRQFFISSLLFCCHSKSVDDRERIAKNVIASDTVFPLANWSNRLDLEWGKDGKWNIVLSHHQFCWGSTFSFSV